MISTARVPTANPFPRIGSTREGKASRALLGRKEAIIPSIKGRPMIKPSSKAKDVLLNAVIRPALTWEHIIYNKMMPMTKAGMPLRKATAWGTREISKSEMPAGTMVNREATPLEAIIPVLREKFTGPITFKKPARTLDKPVTVTPELILFPILGASTNSPTALMELRSLMERAKKQTKKEINIPRSKEKLNVDPDKKLKKAGYSILSSHSYWGTNNM